MSGDWPPGVATYLQQVIVADRAPAWLAVDGDGILTAWGGNTRRYGLPQLHAGRPAEDDFGALTGMLPLPNGQPLVLPCVQFEGGKAADMHCVPGEGAASWVVLLDASSAKSEQVQVQQRGNDMALVRERQTRVLSQYLGHSIAELVSEEVSGAPGSGRRTELSISFTDLRGFTTYSELRPPEEVFELLNKYLGSMIEPVVGAGGVVDKIIGDAVMALYGITPSPDAPAVQAVRAAEGIVAGARAVTAAQPKTPGRKLDVGIGIATGPVALGVLGSRNRRSFSAIGHSVNLAARLESNAAPGQIIIDPNTHASLTPDWAARFGRLRLQLKGIAEPVDAWEWRP